MDKAYINKDYTYFDTEKGKEQIDFLKVLKEREEPLKNISAFYQEQRKLEEEQRKQAEAEELANMTPKPLTPEQQLAKLTDAVAKLTKQLEGKGE